MNANHIFTIGVDVDELAETLESSIETYVDKAVENLDVVTVRNFDENLGDNIEDHLHEYVTSDDLASEVREIIESSDYVDEDGTRELIRDQMEDMTYNLLHDGDLEKVIDARVKNIVNNTVREALRHLLIQGSISLESPTVD